MISQMLFNLFIGFPLTLLAFVWSIAINLGALAYAIMLFMIILGLYRLKFNLEYRGQGFVAPDKLPTISVIIAARDEQRYIRKTLDAILAQDYPADKFNIVVVDDRSTDRTAEIVEEYHAKDPRVTLVRQTEIVKSKSPKKQALALGIASSDGEVIVTTDADCLPRPGWLKGLMSFMPSQVGMVVGQSRFNIGNSPPLWQRLQSLDFQSQGITAAGLVAAGKPFNCSGASFAFRRKLFDEIGGWIGVDHLVSGDDELLLAKAHHAGWRVVATVGQDTVVPTRPPATLKELWSQRIRWGSKGIYYQKFRKWMLAGVFMFCVALVLGPVFSSISFLHIGFDWALYWLFKVGADFIAMYHGSSIFNERFNFLDFLITEIIHPFAIVAFAIGGHFTVFEWKGQRFRSAGTVDV